MSWDVVDLEPGTIADTLTIPLSCPQCGGRLRCAATGAPVAGTFVTAVFEAVEPKRGCWCYSASQLTVTLRTTAPKMRATA